MTTIEKREMVAKSLKSLRARRRIKRLCRECGLALEFDDKTRCFKCKVKHSSREAILNFLRNQKKAVS